MDRGFPELGFAVSFPPDWAVDVRTVSFSEDSVLPGPDVEASIFVNAYVPGRLDGCRVSLPDVARQFDPGPSRRIARSLTLHRCESRSPHSLKRFARTAIDPVAVAWPVLSELQIRQR